jgi:hypothetical protein
LPTETGRVIGRKRIQLPNGGTVDVPVITQIKFLDVVDQGQESEFTVTNTAEANRDVRTASISGDGTAPDETGNSSSDTSQLQIERIDTWRVRDVVAQGQETFFAPDNRTFDSSAVPDFKTPYFITHEQTHVVKYINTPDDGNWIKSELIDKWKYRDVVDQAQETEFFLSNPPDNQDISGIRVDTDSDGNTTVAVDPTLPDISDSNSSIDPPWRLDPFQNVVDFTGGGLLFGGYNPLFGFRTGDGKTWTSVTPPISSPSNAIWVSAAFAGGTWIALAGGIGFRDLSIWRSTDGAKTWQGPYPMPQPPQTRPGYFSQVRGGTPSGSKIPTFVIGGCGSSNVSPGGTNAVAVSTDLGLTWSSATLSTVSAGTDPQVIAFVSFAKDAFFASTTGNNGADQSGNPVGDPLTYLFRSTDGFAWTNLGPIFPSFLPPNPEYPFGSTQQIGVCVSYSKGLDLFIFGANVAVSLFFPSYDDPYSRVAEQVATAISTDGISWSGQTKLESDYRTFILTAVGAGEDRFVIIAESWLPPFQAPYPWPPVPDSTTQWYAYGGPGQFYTVYVSTDGINWSKQFWDDPVQTLPPGPQIPQVPVSQLISYVGDGPAPAFINGTFVELAGFISASGPGVAFSGVKWSSDGLAWTIAAFPAPVGTDAFMANGPVAS